MKTTKHRRATANQTKSKNLVRQTRSEALLRNRRGFLLLAVLLVVSAVTLASLAFMKSMLLGHEESRLTGQSIQARYAADSGIDAARLFVAYTKAQRLEAGGSFDNPNTFQAIPVLQGPDPANPCNYSLVAPSLNEEGKYSGVRFGLQNESAKLNLNVLPMIDSALSIPAAMLGAVSDSMMPTGDSASQPTGSPSIGRDLLMALPAMDESIADAILDFIDPDDDPREFGCEREYYTQLPNPYAPTNGPLSSIEQLLLVRGVTPYLLFGLDQNRNGILESSESSAAQSGMQPGANGMVGSSSPMNLSAGSGTSSGAKTESPPSLGWAMYLTLYSKERNLTSEGQPRVNINNSDMTTLRTDLSTALGEDVATFILAYRAFGPSSGTGSTGGIPGMSGGGGNPGGGNVGGPGGGQGGGGGNGRGPGGPGGNNGGGRQGGGGPGFGPGGGGPGGGGPGGGGPGGGGPGGGGRPGGGGGGGNRGGRSEFALIQFTNPILSLVSMPQPPAGGRGGNAGGNRGGNAGGNPGGGNRGGNAGGGGGRGGQQQGGGMGGGGRGNGGPGNGGPGNGRPGNGNGNRPGGGNNGGGNNGGGNNGGGFGGAGGIGGNNTGGQPTETRPWTAADFETLGIDPALPGQFQVSGVLELVDASFVANVNGTDVRFLSPLTSSPVQMALYLPMLMDKVTTVEAPMLPGRININEAPKEILAGLPGLGSEVLEKLMEARAQTADTENRKYETWPMLEGILTLDQMKSILPLVTAGGDVMRVQSVGYFEQSSGFARTEAVIDGSGQVPVIVLYRKLDHLGRGFSQSTLGQRAMMGAMVSTK